MKNCGDFGYSKTYVNRRLSTEEDVVWLSICENVNCDTEIKDFSKADTCNYYDDDSWIK